MTRRFSSALLSSLRNDIAIHAVIRTHLQLPCKKRDGHLRFLCPHCSDFHTATNPRTNLARCFRCGTNFNPIDLVMAVEQCSFVDAVTKLSALLKP